MRPCQPLANAPRLAHSYAFSLGIEPIWHTIRGGVAVPALFRGLPATTAQVRQQKRMRICLYASQHRLTLRGNLRFP